MLNVFTPILHYFDYNVPVMADQIKNLERRGSGELSVRDNGER